MALNNKRSYMHTRLYTWKIEIILFMIDYYI